MTPLSIPNAHYTGVWLAAGTNQHHTATPSDAVVRPS